MIPVWLKQCEKVFLSIDSLQFWKEAIEKETNKWMSLPLLKDRYFLFEYQQAVVSSKI